MEAVSLSNRAQLTEQIPMARVEERRERKPQREEGSPRKSSTDAHTLKHSHNVPLSPGL